MPDLERRLKAVEKRVQAQHEAIQGLFGDTKALSLVTDALGAAICANNKPLLRTVIKNLRQYEDFARMQNEHDRTIARLRHQREFYEGRLNKLDQGGADIANSGGPPPPK